MVIFYRNDSIQEFWFISHIEAGPRGVLSLVCLHINMSRHLLQYVSAKSLQTSPPSSRSHSESLLCEPYLFLWFILLCSTLGSCIASECAYHVTPKLWRDEVGLWQYCSWDLLKAPSVFKVTTSYQVSGSPTVCQVALICLMVRQIDTKRGMLIKF